MSKGRQLYELQEVDLEIEAQGEALAHVESRLGEREALNEAGAALNRERERLAELERTQRLGEGEVEDLRAKTALLEERLYSGSVRNPKELTSLQEQVEHLKKRRRGQEDRLLDIMTEVEAVQQRVDSKSEELAGMEGSWQEEQNSLAREQAELRAALVTLEQRRPELMARIDSASLELYQALRVKRQGRAVAKVERGTCQGCRIILPMTELQRARMGEEIVQCSSCERIFYVS
ncbi:MAG: zinc ribbon domain-containing protein [Dehalococcoidia bacterium]